MRWWAALLLLFAIACGVKAPPQPPGVPPARRGEPPRLCPGCEIPAPDAHPSPSTEGEGTREEESPVPPEDQIPTDPEEAEDEDGSEDGAIGPP